LHRNEDGDAPSYGSPGIAEIANVGEEGALTDVEGIDGLRHQEVMMPLIPGTFTQTAAVK
jgi:hypothetical protein